MRSRALRSEALRRTYDAGDVLVTGGGMSGILIARALVAMGYHVTLVERDTLVGGQSGHAHGYLHHGYVYLNPRDRLVGPLRSCAARWDELIATTGVPYETHESLLGFGSDAQAEHAVSRWKLANLTDHRRVTREDTVSGTAVGDSLLAAEATHFVVSPEQVVDFTAVTRKLLADDLPGCRLVSATVTGIDASSGRIDRVRLRRDGEEVRAVAALYVFTTGTGSVALVRTARGHAGPVTTRQSYMLVLRHPLLPAVSAAFPGQGSYGLFIAPRRSADGETVWLVSDFNSFAGTDHSQVPARLWLRQISRTLAAYTSVFDLPDLRWSYYPAPKAEVRDSPNLERPRLLDCGWHNAILGLPTKLTLVPMLVDQVATWASIRLREPAPRRPSEPLMPEPPSVATELWRRCTWHPGEDLLRIRDARSPVPLPETLPTSVS